MSRKGRTRGGEWVRQHGRVCRRALVGTMRAISVVFGINGLRNELSHLVGSPYPESLD